MPFSAIEAYEFGPYRIDTGERLLYRDGELIPLPPKVVGTLLVLVGNAGRMVDKADLMKAVWPDTFVEEGALTRNISLLRKTLGDTGEEAAYIETIPRRGYRFVAPVRTVGAAETASGDPGAPAETQPSAQQPAEPPSPASRFAPRFTTKWMMLAGILLLAALAAIARFTAGNGSMWPATPAVAPANTLAVLPFRSVEKDASRTILRKV